jgi:2',3'-cyclic-nucleotide 3'-phosphodiesterase
MTSILACIPDQVAPPVVFSSLEVGPTYFRSVYVVIHKSPELLDLHKHINNELKKLDGIEPRSPRFPHMSLFYIEDSEPGDERQMVADELLSSGRAINEPGERIVLDCFTDGHSTGYKLYGFDGEQIWIVRCEGPVEQWKVLEKVVLPHP